MAKMATRNRWSFAEDRRLIQLAATLKSLEAVADQMKRTPERVARMAKRLGVSDPAIFWIFDEISIPPPGRLVAIASDTGDLCHFDLCDLPDKILKAFLKSAPLSDLSICDPSGQRVLQLSDLTA
jgi:hypothetical protein